MGLIVNRSPGNKLILNPETSYLYPMVKIESDISHRVKYNLVVISVELKMQGLGKRSDITDTRPTKSSSSQHVIVSTDLLLQCICTNPG